MTLWNKVCKISAQEQVLFFSVGMLSGPANYKFFNILTAYAISRSKNKWNLKTLGNENIQVCSTGNIEVS